MEHLRRSSPSLRRRVSRAGHSRHIFPIVKDHSTWPSSSSLSNNSEQLEEDQKAGPLPWTITEYLSYATQSQTLSAQHPSVLLNDYRRITWRFLVTRVLSIIRSRYADRSSFERLRAREICPSTLTIRIRRNWSVQGRKLRVSREPSLPRHYRFRLCSLDGWFSWPLVSPLRRLVRNTSFHAWQRRHAVGRVTASPWILTGGTGIEIKSQRKGKIREEERRRTKKRHGGKDATVRATGTGLYRHSELQSVCHWLLLRPPTTPLHRPRRRKHTMLRQRVVGGSSEAYSPQDHRFLVVSLTFGWFL